MTPRWSVDALSASRSFGVKLVLLGGTMGLVAVTGLVFQTPKAPPVEETPVHIPRGVYDAPRNMRVDINHGSPDALRALPGIGKVLAGRIVRYRRAHGHFLSVEDITRVKGIGAKSLERLRPYIHVEHTARDSGE